MESSSTSARQSPDGVSAETRFANGTWTVILSRKLAGSEGQVSFTPGTHYTVGFAIHTGHTAGRFHYIANERDMSIDSGSGDFVAVKK